MRGGRAMLAVPLPCDMNRIAFCASPFFGIELLCEALDFFFVDDYHMVRNTMILFV
jgi:hypothetical protein